MAKIKKKTTSSKNNKITEYVCSNKNPKLVVKTIKIPENYLDGLKKYCSYKNIEFNFSELVRKALYKVYI